MEKLVFKNMYLNTILGGVLIILSLLGYFLGWFEDFLPYVVAALLILLSTKRFTYSFKKITSKNATLILVIEYILDLIFGGLLIYLQDHTDVFIGLIIYIRGVSYLLINYIATRKIKLFQYILNILYVTLGAFLMFGPWDSELFLVLFISVLFLLVGAIYLQAGVSKLAEKEKKEEAKDKQEKEAEKRQQDVEKKQEKINKLEAEIKEVQPPKKETPKPVTEVKETKPPKAPPINYAEKTVVELKDIAKERKLEGYSKLTKAELIQKLKETK